VVFVKGEKTYEKHGFKIKYPKKWKIEEGKGYNARFCKNHEMYESTLTIRLHDISGADGEVTLDSYIEENIDMIKKVDESAGNFSVTERKFLQQPGKQMVYTNTDFMSDVAAKNLVVLTQIKNDNIVILLIFSAETQYFDEDVKIAEEMMETFEYNK